MAARGKRGGVHRQPRVELLGEEVVGNLGDEADHRERGPNRAGRQAGDEESIFDPDTTRTLREQVGA